ncbi:hypothetical protein EAF04_003305 [Stromatinia cepivora]|nr:hypothetical protein EAF04_003305 [Stromatinia cepivora]
MDIADPIVRKTNAEDIEELDVMQIDEPAAGEEDPKLRPVEDEVHRRREKTRDKRRETRREKGQHTSNLERLSIKDQQNQIAQLQKENFGALRRQIEQTKVILDNIPVKECIQETEVETAQKMTLLMIYKLYFHMEKEIIALHSTPSLLSYNVMVERIIRIKEILKDNYGMDELENESYGQNNTIHFTYNAILNIERRMRFLSAIAVEDTEEIVKRLMNHRLYPGEYCDLNSKINTTNLPLNPNLGILHWEKKRIEFVWECAKRISKVGYFMRHKCSYTFLTKMCENPDELLTIFSQQE